MSSEKYLNARTKLMNDKQCQIMVNLFMKGVNHDGHSWNTFGDIEDAVADLMEAGRENVGMLTADEASDAAILNMDGWDYEDNGKFEVDEQTARALVQEYTRLKTENNTLKRHIAANMYLSRYKEL